MAYLIKQIMRLTAGCPHYRSYKLKKDHPRYRLIELKVDG